MARKIPLTQGKYTIVDDADYEWLSQYNWQVDSDGYAVRSARGEERSNGCKVRMARAIMKAPKGKQVDHINGDRLDNRRLNLRSCTNAENTRNGSHHRTNTSGYKGVYWNKREKKWRAHIRANNIHIHLGYFKSVIEGAKAYDVAAKKYFGEFARLNFPKTGHGL